MQLQGPEEVVGGLYSVPNKTESRVFKECQVSGTSMSIVKANCSSRSPLLYRRPEVPQGSQDFPQCVSGHQQLLLGHRFDHSSRPS